MKKNVLNLIMIITMSIGTITTLSAQNKSFIGSERSILSSGIENQNPYGIEKLPAINTYGSTLSLVLGKHMKHGFSISIEPTYAQLGQNYLDVLPEEDYLRNISLDYVQLPFMLSKVFGEEKVKIQTKVGLYGAYLVNSVFEESTMISDGTKVGPTITERNSDRFSKFDMGVKAGLGSQIAFTERIALNLDYNVNAGLSDLNSDAYIYTPGYSLEYKKSRNVYMALGLGVQYNF